MSEAAAVAEPVAVEPTALEIQPPDNTAQPVVEPVVEPANENWLPEKHIVKKEDGTIDLEASARKQAEAYKSLEQRIGSGDIRPKTPDDYAPELAFEGITLDDLKSDEQYKDFVAKAHEKGLNNDQLSFVLNEFFPRMAESAELDAAEAREACNAQLKEFWPTDSEMNQNKLNALKTIKAFAGSPEEEAKIVRAVGNNAVALKLLATIGPELQEGRSPSGAQVGMMDVEALQKSEAYWNPNHPDHTATKLKVERYYNEKFPKK